MPVLWVLFLEVLLSQSLSSILSFLFVSEIKGAIRDDALRAGYMGQCYAWINGISGLLQFLIVPGLMSRYNSRWIWVFMPIVMAGLTTLSTSWGRRGPLVGGVPFLAMKTMEYSLRSFSVEMVCFDLPKD